MRWRLAIAACVVLAAGAVYLGVWWSPPAEEAGDVMRVMYLHVPAAANTLLAFTIAAAASVVHLVRNRDGADRLARAAAGAGLILGTVMLASGMAWARLAWGHWWDFKSPRLMLSLLMWILFIAYFLLRASLGQGPRRRKVDAAFCIIANLDVPLVYVSARLLGTDIHPIAAALDDPRMQLALAAAFLAMSAVHALLLVALLKRARAVDRQTPPLP
jgi:heme exporter protein C